MPEGGQAELVEGGAGALLDVPVVADGGEVRFARVAGLDGVQGGAGGGDAEGLVDPEAGVERGLLREVADLADGLDAAVGGGEFAGDQLQQGGLPRAVEADQAGAAGADGELEAVQDRRAVGPGEVGAGADDGRGGGGGGL
ncbi:hypothetical protein SAZ_11375 [Streptomyces noursei ZPM]|nr:hypothetical protein SAZ_11375 [Streptomyces noursei ZPM]EPY92088.1 hypothetical protein K530_55175 [Streptomyces noursei CCRC 11814]EXU89968.1 hypothetical protein P354_19175 [Streptomyces noursei PD-1]